MCNQSIKLSFILLILISILFVAKGKDEKKYYDETLNYWVNRHILSHPRLEGAARLLGEYVRIRTRTSAEQVLNEVRDDQSKRVGHSYRYIMSYRPDQDRTLVFLLEELKNLNEEANDRNCYLDSIQLSLGSLKYFSQTGLTRFPREFLYQDYLPYGYEKLYNYIRDKIIVRLENCSSQISTHFHELVESEADSIKDLDKAFKKTVQYKTLSRKKSGDEKLLTVSKKQNSIPYLADKTKTDSICERFVLSSSNSIGIYVLAQEIVPDKVDESIESDMMFMKLREYARVCQKVAKKMIQKIFDKGQSSNQSK